MDFPAYTQCYGYIGWNHAVCGLDRPGESCRRSWPGVPGAGGPDDRAMVGLRRSRPRSGRSGQPPARWRRRALAGAGGRRECVLCEHVRATLRPRDAVGREHGANVFDTSTCAPRCGARQARLVLGRRAWTKAVVTRRQISTRPSPSGSSWRSTRCMSCPPARPAMPARVASPDARSARRQARSRSHGPRAASATRPAPVNCPRRQAPQRPLKLVSRRVRPPRPPRPRRADDVPTDPQPPRCTSRRPWRRRRRAAGRASGPGRARDPG
jgi:hypothetical protein